MVRILEKPAALSFSGNLTKFLVESDQPFAFSLKKKSAASSIFEHTYYPGTDKRSRIDVSNIIEDYLYFTLQANTNVHLQPNIKGVFVATIDTQTVEFEVIRGGISNLADTTVNWLKYNFLTWQPIEKNVTYHSPEWISWYAVSTCALMLDATFEDQSRKSIKITDCQPGNVYTANLQYGYIAGLLGKLPSYYDVYLLYTDSQKSQVQRYLASDPKSEDEIYVGWDNSLGGYDVARMSGYSTFENEGKHEVGSNGDSLEEYNTELSKKHVCNTGLMTLSERFWFVDFFISKRRHVYIDNAMREIVLSEDKGSINTAETIDGLSFTFREKEDSKYLNIPRLRELPSDITIPVPALPDFNLPPRLVEYARITLDEGVLFPAQHPNSQTCGVTTWGAMSTIINKWITDAIAAIKFPDIPDIPETLPPGPHTHPIEDVVQLKTELERRLLKETFDALFRYDATLDCLFVSKPIAVQGSVTMYSNAGTLDLPSIYDGIPLGDGLVWKDGKIVVTIGGGLDEAALGNYLTTHKYATQTWVTSQLSSLHTHSNKSVLDAITSGKVGNWDSAYNHISDTTKHITTTERNTWNAKEAALGTPSTNGYLLSSTTSGIRSWVKPYELTKDEVVRVLKDSDGCIRLDASMLLSGGLTMLSNLGIDVPSIFDNAPIATPRSKGMLDNSILGTGLSWVGGKLTATSTSGTFDHTALSNRNAADQHSITAITGLQAALDGKSPMHSHPYRPDTWMPTATQVGALAVNGKAADSDRLNGLDSSYFARITNGASNDLNTLFNVQAGLHMVDGSLSNTPLSTANMRVLQMGTTYRGTQMAFDWISDRVFFRRKQDSLIGNWQEIWHTGNFTPNVNKMTSKSQSSPMWYLLGTTINNHYNGFNAIVTGTGVASGGAASTYVISAHSINGVQVRKIGNIGNYLEFGVVENGYVKQVWVRSRSTEFTNITIINNYNVGGAVVWTNLDGSAPVASGVIRIDTPTVWDGYNANNLESPWTAKNLRTSRTMVGIGAISFNRNCDVGGLFDTSIHGVQMTFRDARSTIETALIFECFNGSDGITGSPLSMKPNGMIGVNARNPSISLAIGDDDTGLHWGGDGLIYAKANGVDAFAWTSSELAVYRPINNNYPSSAHSEINLTTAKLNFTSQPVNRGSVVPLIKAQTILAAEGWIQNVLLCATRRSDNADFGDVEFRLGQNDQGSVWRTFSFKNGGHFTVEGDIIAGYGNGNSYNGSCFYRPAISGNPWNSGNGALTVDVVNNGNQTTLLLARREGTSARMFAIEQLNGGRITRIYTGANNNNIVLSSSGRVSINRLGEAQATLHVGGNILADGGITMLSDMRLKKRIDTAKSVLPHISTIDVFRYTLKADTAKRIYIGVSAQQIQGIWREFVHGVETLSLDYAQMAAYVAIKGLQETKLWMDSKDKKIAELEKRIVELEKNVA